VTVLTRAAIVAVGSELLTPSKIDTNSLYITEQLNRLGIEVMVKLVVGDLREELTEAVRSLLARVDVLILSGGLGPTDDDVTREAVSAALGRPLAEDEAITQRLRERFKARGFAMPMPETNRRQAMVPAGAVVVENRNGSAPGLWIDHQGKIVVLLPGPPRELRPMLAELVDGPLRASALGEPLMRRVVRITGRIESDVDQLLQPIYREWAAASPAIAATILASPGAIELHLSTHASSQDVVDRALESAVQRVVNTIGADVYSTDGRKLEQVVGDLLVAKRMRVAVAESCTGGLITSRLTDVPGSSRYVDQSIITYSNEAKTELLGVPTELLEAHGAVSEPVGLAMADGIRTRARADVGVGVTGIAGPTGGTTEKPVGTVVVTATTANERRVRTFRFFGDRELVKFQASQAALDMVRRLLS
jgi:competence/damage-inducible protein CinA-like protein